MNNNLSYQEKKELTKNKVKIHQLINFDKELPETKVSIVVPVCNVETYLRECFDNILQITDTLNDEQLVNLLSVENYIKDGKDFTKSKEYINGTRTALEICKQKYTEFLTEEKAMSYINDKGLDEYYIDLYKQEFVGDMSEASDGEVESSIDEIIKILDISEQVLNLLSENQNAWEIEGENIVFNSETLSNQYDELINQL